MAMTREQFLYTKLAEECNEVAHICSKIVQFGAQDYHPHTHIQNVQALHGELNDMKAVIQMLNDECGMGYRIDVQGIEKKKAKINKWAAISTEMGFVEA